MPDSPQGIGFLNTLAQAFEPGSYSPLWRALMPDSPQDTPAPISAEPSGGPSSVPFAELSSDSE
eukprot:scaffold192214_cov21-Tisochrysis_lutea.AAC.1